MKAIIGFALLMLMVSCVKDEDIDESVPYPTVSVDIISHDSEVLAGDILPLTAKVNGDYTGIAWKFDNVEQHNLANDPTVKYSSLIKGVHEIVCIANDTNNSVSDTIKITVK